MQMTCYAMNGRVNKGKTGAGESKAKMSAWGSMLKKEWNS